MRAYEEQNPEHSMPQQCVKQVKRQKPPKPNSYTTSWMNIQCKKNCKIKH